LTSELNKDASSSGQGPVTGSYEHGNVSPVSMKGGVLRNN